MRSPLVLLLLAAIPFLGAGELNDLLSSPETLWQLTPKALNEKYPNLLTRRSDGAFYAGPGTVKEFTLDEQPVYDLDFVFQDGTLAAVHVALHTRGDVGKPLPAREGGEKLDALERRIATFYVPGSRGRKLQAAKLGGTRIKTTLFTGKQLSAALICGTLDGGALEFITVDFLRPGISAEHLRRAMRSKTEAGDLPARRQEEEGGYFLTLPMVDQGPKGYCVPAAVNRVLLYYGGEVDLHALAGMLGADAQKGTDLEDAVRRLKKLDSRLGVRFMDLYRFQDFDSNRVRQFLKRYNHAARKLGEERLDLSLPRGGLKFTAPVMAEIRRDPGRCDNFFRQVKTAIDRGVPLCWGVMVFPKQAGDKCEFHLRLITGYRDNPRRIVYSDTWGDGHDKSVMPVEEAWPRTIRLFLLNPKI
ncbi:MAG: hypothetical protein MR051_06085 [Lentisphaeria bacterium]|nr:hypothetical protein [Lentisphaeria bacterium]